MPTLPKTSRKVFSKRKHAAIRDVSAAHAKIDAFLKRFGLTPKPAANIMDIFRGHSDIIHEYARTPLGVSLITRLGGDGENIFVACELVFPVVDAVNPVRPRGGIVGCGRPIRWYPTAVTCTAMHEGRSRFLDFTRYLFGPTPKRGYSALTADERNRALLLLVKYIHDGK